MSSGVNGINDALPAGATQWDRRDGDLGNLPNGGALILEIATSMEWDIDTYGPSGTGSITASDIADLTGLLANSPDVVRQTAGPDAGLAILAGDGYSYLPLPGSEVADWIYEVAYEFAFDASLFGDEWANPSTDISNLLSLPRPHASPNKGFLGQADIGEPVFTPVTEPATALLLVLGLLVTGWRRREMLRQKAAMACANLRIRSLE